jgi:hypothetical protein
MVESVQVAIPWVETVTHGLEQNRLGDCVGG